MAIALPATRPAEKLFVPVIRGLHIANHAKTELIAVIKIRQPGQVLCWTIDIMICMNVIGWFWVATQARQMFMDTTSTAHLLAGIGQALAFVEAIGFFGLVYMRRS